MTSTYISGSGVTGPNGALTVGAAGNTVAVRGALDSTVGAVTSTVSSVVGIVPALCNSTVYQTSGDGWRSEWYILVLYHFFLGHMHCLIFW